MSRGSKVAATQPRRRGADTHLWLFHLYAYRPGFSQKPSCQHTSCSVSMSDGWARAAAGRPSTPRTSRDYTRYRLRRVSR